MSLLQGTPTPLQSTLFATSEWVPSPACLAVSAGGKVYVGVDRNGSLGKGPGKGQIVLLEDHNQDGQVDRKGVFAEIDHPRGLIALLDQVYVLHARYDDEGEIAGMFLSVLEDRDHDGLADGPARVLVEQLSTLQFNRSRGVDHSANGIQMGIDGWIYLAIGDFGMVQATGTDGQKLTLLGGGVVRVRPDGSELEPYSTGFRNLYDLAIDPYMNLFSRGNTNDGVGWWVRFSHHLQSADYGYPSLYTHFTDEILPALADLGPGSGTGALFLDEPAWKGLPPSQKVLTADWGRNQLFVHPLTPDAASFTVEQTPFLTISQPSDLDVDAAGQLYVAAWEGAGYKGSDEKGRVYRIIPPDWKPRPYQNLGVLSDAQLREKLCSESFKTRLEASQLYLERRGPAAPLLQIVKDPTASPSARIAALYTFAQLTGEEGTSTLLSLPEEPLIHEHALRAATDRRSYAPRVPTENYQKALQSDHPRVAAQAVISIGRIGDPQLAPQLIALTAGPSRDYNTFLLPPEQRVPGPHAQPHSALIIPHLAVQTLRRLQAEEACLAALEGPTSDGALWALRALHTPAAVDGLIKKAQKTSDPQFKLKLMDTLARLYSRESPYRGQRWWNTKPDPHGPYFWETTWSESPKIAAFYRKMIAQASVSEASAYKRLAEVNKAYLPGVYQKPQKRSSQTPKVGQTSIENVLLALDRLKPDLQNGKKLLARQACVACHRVEPSDRALGPDLHQIGAHLSVPEIAEAILKPNATIAQNWVSLVLQDQTKHTGTLVNKEAETITLRDLAGETTTYPSASVESLSLADYTTMAPHLLNALTLKEFVDVVYYLGAKK